MRVWRSLPREIAGSNKYFSMTSLIFTGFTRLWLSAEVHLQTYTKMETRVELWIEGGITPTVKKEVRDLTKMNASNNKEIKIWPDEIDDDLLIIRFNSHSGKSDELAGEIMKSYSLYLDNYSDITVMFETRKKGLDRATDGITKKEVIEKIGEFYSLLDDKNWIQLQLFFLDKIEYLECQEGPRIRNRTGKRISSNRYLSQKEKSLQRVITNHKLNKNNLSKRGGLIVCEVDYLMERINMDGVEEKPLKGKQEFGIVSISDKLKISRIANGRKKSY